MESKNGKDLWNCRAGCDQQQLTEELKRRGIVVDMQDYYWKPNIEYRYYDEHGNLVAIKGRLDTPRGKEIKWRLPNGSYSEGLAGKVRTENLLYGLPQLLKNPDDVVFVVEGEKACEACWNNGILAVSFAGGASQSNFGTAIEHLYGRKVILWPDNDPQGKKLMVRIDALLRGKAQIRWVMPPVPAKGDAHDFFAAGGTVDQLHSLIDNEASMALSEIDARFESEDEIVVRVNTEIVPIVFRFSSIEVSSRSWDAELSVTVDSPASKESFFQRINLLSSSQRQDLRRELESFFDQFDKKSINWIKVINLAFMNARKVYSQVDDLVEFHQIQEPDTSVRYDIYPLGIDGESNLIYGAGESWKSYLMIALSLASACGVEIAGMHPKRCPTLYIDYESSQDNFGARLYKVARGLGVQISKDSPLFYLHAKGRPIWELADRIKKYIEHHGIGRIIIDSAGEAAVESEDSGNTCRYFATINSFGVTSYTIAHVAKDSNGLTPFGSVYWYNLPSMIWHIRKIQSEESNELLVALRNTKSRNDRRHGQIALRVVFDDDVVTVNRTSIDRIIRAEREEIPLHIMIRDYLLKNGASKVSEIANALGKPENTIREIIRRHKEEMKFAEVGSDGREKLWGILSDDAEF